MKYINDLNKYDFWTNKKIIFFDSLYVYLETYSYFVLYGYEEAIIVSRITIFPGCWTLWNTIRYY